MCLFKGFLQGAVPEVIQMAMGLDNRVIEYGNLATFFTHELLLGSYTGGYIDCFKGILGFEFISCPYIGLQ
ncbi:hypothetical protein GCM10011533_12790 [Streptosporangium jomthongense]|nr:hypothetical protein GCM10011533_12790 [Streptosporangium jomthongense]